MNDLSLWLTVVLAALVSLFAVYFAVLPLLQPGRATLLLDDDKLAGLLGRKDALLQAIKDLEFDYHVGKMSQEDYQRLDQRMRRQAIGLMQQIEKLAPASASLDEQLEGIIAQYRQTSGASLAGAPLPGSSASGNGDNGDIATATPVATAVESQPGRFCTQCGKPVAAGHNFCAHCGTPVAQPNPAPQM